MFGLDLAQLGFIVLVVLAVAALAYVFFFDSIAWQKKADERLKEVKLAATDSLGKFTVRDKQAEAVKRRKSVQDTLKDIEQRQKLRDKNIKSPPLKMLIQQAGMKVTLPRFYLYSVITGVVVTDCSACVWIAALSRAGIVSCGRSWSAAMVRLFPPRPPHQGVPQRVSECHRRDRARHPVGSAAERWNPAHRAGSAGTSAWGISPHRRCATGRRQHSGRPPCACPNIMPCAEASFFGIVIQIQSQAGGNLSEALGNLSRVLRDRKKMAAKVQALSMEAKASAYIIGALPFIVALLVYLTSPQYIMILFNTNTGNFILACAGDWMSIGILVMKKMINFKF